MQEYFKGRLEREVFQVLWRFDSKQTQFKEGKILLENLPRRMAGVQCP
jgi:hypothetical protein